MSDRIDSDRTELDEKLTQTQTSLEEKITQAETSLNENIAQTKSSLEENISQTETSLEEKIAAITQGSSASVGELEKKLEASHAEMLEIDEKQTEKLMDLFDQINSNTVYFAEKIALTEKSLEEKINAKMDDVPLDPDGGIVKTDAGLAVSDIKELHEATDGESLLNTLESLEKSIYARISEESARLDREVTNMDAEGKVREALAGMDLMDELGGRFSESITRLEQGLATANTNINTAQNTANNAKSTANSKVTFDQIYPVGSIYISVNNVKPPLGTWQKLATGVTLWNDPTPNGRTIAAGLPNITGTAKGDTFDCFTTGAAIYWEGKNAISTYVENTSGAFASYKGSNAYAK